MSVNYNELKRLRDELVNLKKDETIFIKRFLMEMGQRVLYRTKKRTPVDTGYLVNHWYLSDVFKKNEHELYVVLYNIAEYASHVEYGHAVVDKNGDYVRRVNGKYMATISIAEIEREIPKRYESALKSFLQGKGYKYLK